MSASSIPPVKPTPPGGQPRLPTLEERNRVHAALGQIVLALSVVSRYRHQSFADLNSLIVEPLIRERIAIAQAKPVTTEEGAAGPLAGIAIWATVSDEVDAKIREQIKAGAFPIRLKPEEWTSGSRVWLLDVIAPTQQIASAVLANFSQVVKNGEVRIHPLIARLVDPELLKKLGAIHEAPVAGSA